MPIPPSSPPEEATQQPKFFPVYRQDFETAIKEIKANKGVVHHISGREIFYTDGSGEKCVYSPEFYRNTEGCGIFWHKKKFQ